MTDKIIDIASNNIYLNIYRGFIKLQKDKQEIGRIAIDDILAIVVSGYNIGYSHNVLVQLAQEAIPLFICGQNHHPIAYMLSCDANYKQFERTNLQVKATEAFKKNLWKSIIKHKILNQHKNLISKNIDVNQLKTLAEKVKSGDSDNIEAQAAKIYWANIFGSNFYRNQNNNGINSLLNYGYSIIRAAIARYVIASGLNPSFSVFHKNKLNSFCLVDDLIEPYRAWIDHKVSIIIKNDFDGNITPKIKQFLVETLQDEVKFNNKKMELKNSIKEYIYLVVRSYESKNIEVQFPEFKFCED